ncbi:MAG: type IV pilus assembly protein PilM [bacterium]|nr:type IV pilus assembly protein PilM [bacterium]
MSKQELIYKQKDCLGLDIGASSVKIVQLKKKKSLTKLMGYESRELPDNLVIEGIISDHDKMVKIIREMMTETQEGKFSVEKVIASIPDKNIFTRVLELPKLAEKELKEAVMWEADQSIPMALTDLTIDFQVLGPSATKEDMNDVLLVAAPLAIVNSYVQLFERLGLQPEAIETSLVSVIRALVSNKEHDEVMLVADIGARSTNLGFYDHTLRLSDSLDIGGKAWIDLIISGLKVEKKEADKLLFSKGLKDKKIESLLQPELENLNNEMQKVIKYHDERFEKKTAKVVLCGGASNLVGLTEYLANSLGIEVKIGNPWVNIDTYPLKPVPKSEAPAFANAIGLALRSLEGA